MSETFRVIDGIAAIAEEAWDGLLDPLATPFVQWAFLEALESTGCATPDHGWRARHLTLWRGATLIAAAPAYAKTNHEGDFGRDWIWADAYHRIGARYYPRLLVTIPITPVGGRRFLVAPGEDRQACVNALLGGARILCNEEKYSSIHVLFPIPEELPELTAAGLGTRVDFQAHWFNHGYTDHADYLARGLDSKRRHLVRHEQAKPAEQGITIRTVRGEAVAAERERWGREVGRFYKSTVDKMRWGRPWLNPAFFARIFKRMPGPLEVVVAERAGKVVAGAFNVFHGDRLYGRYWGCHEEHDLLHFNVCLHHSVDDCIARGIAVFEGGAGGEHKLFRGFDMGATHSAHQFMDPRIDREIRKFLETEGLARADELAKWHHKKRKKAPAQTP